MVFEMMEAVCITVVLVEVIGMVLLILLRLVCGFRIQIDYYYEKKDLEETKQSAGADRGMEEGICPIDGHECYGATFHVGQPLICWKCVEFRDIISVNREREEKKAEKKAKKAKKKKKGDGRNEITEREQGAAEQD